MSYYSCIEIPIDAFPTDIEIEQMDHPITGHRYLNKHYENTLSRVYRLGIGVYRTNHIFDLSIEKAKKRSLFMFDNNDMCYYTIPRIGSIIHSLRLTKPDCYPIPPIYIMDFSDKRVYLDTIQNVKTSVGTLRLYFDARLSDVIRIETRYVVLS